VQGNHEERLVTTAEQAAQGRDSVLMEFPNEVLLSKDDGGRVLFGKGINPVPRELADHWYLKAHGAKPVE